MKRKDVMENIAGYLFILPSTILLLAFIIYPLISSFYNSFTSWNLITDARFVGLRNYTELVKDGEFDLAEFSADGLFG